MLLCMFEIRKFKLIDKKEIKNNESSSSKCSNKSCLQNAKTSLLLNLDRIFFLIKAKLKFNPIKSIKKQDTNKMNGYYYDYKYGAGGFYLKAGLACKIIFFFT